MYPSKLGYVLWECECCSECGENDKRYMAVLILQSCVEGKHCILSLTSPHAPTSSPYIQQGEKLFSSPFAVVREVHGGSEMFVFVLLAEFSVCGSSQFRGAPRERISTDGGFNWSVGFQNQGYMLLQPAILICLFACLFICLCVVFQQDNHGVCRQKWNAIMLSCSYRFNLLIKNLTFDTIFVLFSRHNRLEIVFLIA